jgi:Tannase and feruloyl esterase
MAWAAPRNLCALSRPYGSAAISTDPNLSAFQQRGGKLILFHGWTDAAISPIHTIHQRSRPICPWAQTAKYKGTGSIDDAGSFNCAK